MKSIETLIAISERQELDAGTVEAARQAEFMLERDLAAVERHFVDAGADGPVPINDIANYILDGGGKRIRPMLCLLAARTIHKNEAPIGLAVVCELLHNATLLHDDVIDEGNVRRGKPAARKVWTNALSVLGGDYLLMRCVEMISASHPSHMPLFTATLRKLVEGEIVQLGLRGSVDAIEADYFTVIEGKTASLFSFATAAGAAFAGADQQVVKKFGAFGRHVGLAFQMIDDLLDFSADKALVGKDLLADIGQGKITLPVIVAANRDASVKPLLKRMVEGEAAAPLAEAISEKVRSTNALDQVRAVAAHHTDAARTALDGLAGCDTEVISILRQVSLGLLSRGH